MTSTPRDLPLLDTAAFPIVLSAPSGAGKTTIAHALVERNDDITFSVSMTTRPRRFYEKDGVDYGFASEAEFERLIAEGAFVEFATVHGHRYGTLRSAITTAIADGSHVVLDIDVQGARQIRSAVPEALSIFILPPSGRVLVDRLMGRGSEDPEDRRRRVANARMEIGAASEFDYIVVNDDLDEAINEIEAVIDAEHARIARIPGLEASMERLRTELDRQLQRLEKQV